MRWQMIGRILESILIVGYKTALIYLVGFVICADYDFGDNYKVLLNENDVETVVILMERV